MDAVRRVLNVATIVAIAAVTAAAVILLIDIYLQQKSKQSLDEVTQECVSEWDEFDRNDRAPLDVGASSSEIEAWNQKRWVDRQIAENRCAADAEANIYTPDYRRRPPFFSIAIALLAATLFLNYVLFGKATLWNRLESLPKEQ